MLHIFGTWPTNLDHQRSHAQSAYTHAHTQLGSHTKSQYDIYERICFRKHNGAPAYHEHGVKDSRAETQGSPNWKTIWIPVLQQCTEQISRSFHADKEKLSVINERRLETDKIFFIIHHVKLMMYAYLYMKRCHSDLAFRSYSRLDFIFVFRNFVFIFTRFDTIWTKFDAIFIPDFTVFCRTWYRECWVKSFCSSFYTVSLKRRRTFRSPLFLCVTLVHTVYFFLDKEFRHNLVSL